MADPTDLTTAPCAFELAMLTDLGTNRSNNEDCCGQFIESPASAVLVVADGIGGYEGGEVASRMAVDITIETYRTSPVAWGPAKRMHRAVQRANIEIHNRALAVPELRRMGTTLTAAVVDEGMMHAAHVGDCRLYLVRRGEAIQITKDHTMIAERVRMGLMSAQRARNHPERSALSRSIGHELIVSVDVISMPLVRDDQILICSDGLHGVLDDRELAELMREGDAAATCHRLIGAANEKGTGDNLTAAVLQMIGATPHAERRARGGWLRRLFARSH